MDGPVIAKLRCPRARNDEFPGLHDLLCFAVNGLQDCPTCDPASRLDMLVSRHVDIFRAEYQV